MLQRLAPCCHDDVSRSSGLLVGQLDQVSFFEKALVSNDFKPHLLPIHGTNLYYTQT